MYPIYFVDASGQIMEGSHRYKLKRPLLSPLNIGLSWSGQAGKQNRENTRQKNSVERSSAADRGDGGANSRDLAEIKQVRTNKRPQAAANVSELSCVLA